MRKRVIFVFGSNLAGRHGKGAALYALRHYGAEYGVGEGLTGDSYALPTKTADLNPRTLAEIRRSVRVFRDVAKEMPECVFILTPVGTGLAGHSKRDIWTLLVQEGLPANVALSQSWLTPL